ncbi:NADP-dependent oxidoreductase [Lactobacillus sp.]|uniref:NADP-dependent oxidoreductase n=1 Tax=Lactobacillus sp. TaxID=1591 RepID=UPI0019CC83A8|nr:NADP-dependent oxidoreductase [Lactobacillus sp.]MBD5429224.1 NADP-dependent oxidoreductase [Lactobacillus sp.]
MKAVQLEKYNSKNPIIKLRDVQPKSLLANDVLVKVTFAGVNPLDNLISHGDLRLVVPYKLPQIMGYEFVGIIEQVGTNVSHFKIGDRVFGRNPIDNIGSFAQQVVVNQSAIAKVPNYLSNQEAAAIPLTALTAMQALDKLGAQSGQTLFISGGTGSFGAMAIPLAVARGLKVITSGSSSKREYVEKLGVTKFIDYKKEDYTKVISNVDLVIDTVGESEIFKELSILKEGGKIVSLRAMPNAAFAKSMGMGIFKQMLFAVAAHKIEKVAKKKKQTYNFIFVEANGSQLAQASKILDKSNIHPALGEIYPLSKANDALNAVARGKNRGKILINTQKI